jgi:hypothetical protein
MKTDITKLLCSMRGYTIIGLLRLFMMKMRKQQVLVTGGCRSCGACCRKLSLDDGRGWIRSEKQFASILSESPDYRCFEIIGRDSSGILLFSCTHSTEEGLCGTYETRFRFCKEFPDKNLIFCGGGLPSGCGYNLHTGVPFSTILQSTLDKHNEKNPDT